jgi:hypothetical protein
MQIGVFGALGILFVALKLTGVIAWDWIWVTAPFWGGLAVAFIFITISLIAALIISKT